MKEMNSKSLSVRLDLLEKENKALRDELRSLSGKLVAVNEAASCSVYLQAVLENQLKLNQKIENISQEIQAAGSELPPTNVKCSGSLPNSLHRSSRSIAVLISDSVAELSGQLAQVYSMLAELKATQQGLKESLTTTKLFYDKEIWLLEEKWKQLAKDLGEQTHTLNLAQKIDWSRLSEDLQVEEQRAQAIAKSLLEKIRQREANIHRLIEAKSGRVVQGAAEAKKIKVNAVRMPPKDRENPAKPPEQSQASQNRQPEGRPQVDHEEFELELTDNSVSRSGGLHAGLPEGAENADLKKKLLFDDPLPLESTGVPNGRKSLAPSSLLRMRKKTASNENSFVRDPHKSQSQNNSLLDHSNASRRKKQTSNVIIRTKSVSNQGDNSERRPGVLSPISDQKIVPKHFPAPEHSHLDHLRSSLEFSDLQRKDSMFDLMFAKKQFIGKVDSKENTNTVKTTPVSSFHTRTVSFDDQQPNASIDTKRIQIGLDRSLSIKSSSRRRKPANP